MRSICSVPSKDQMIKKGIELLMDEFGPSYDRHEMWTSNNLAGWVEKNLNEETVDDPKRLAETKGMVLDWITMPEGEIALLAGHLEDVVKSFTEDHLLTFIRNDKIIDMNLEIESKMWSEMLDMLCIED